MANVGVKRSGVMTARALLMNNNAESLPSASAVVGHARGINMGGPTGRFGDVTFGEHMHYGVIKSTTEGSPATPSLALTQAGNWRFRWVVRTGTRTISINVKQASNQTSRPSMVIKSNTSIGIDNDVSGSAPAGTDWVTIGPLTVIPTGTDVVWVELYNNSTLIANDPAYFDHIVVT